MDKKLLFRLPIWVLIGSMLLSAVGCSGKRSSAENTEQWENVAEAAPDYTNTERYEGEPSSFISSVYTAERKLSLTFNGMSDRESMLLLLDELERLHMTATFFLPGLRVAEEPDVAKEILDRGHEVESNTLSRSNLGGMSYSDIFKEVDLGASVMEDKLGTEIQYVRSAFYKVPDDLMLAASHSGLKAVIGQSVTLNDVHLEKELQDQKFLRLQIKRGTIISIDLEKNNRAIEMLPILNDAVSEVGYEWVRIDNLMEAALEKKPLEQIEGYDAAVKNLDDANADYELFYRDLTPGKEISLTFDDWGTDYTVTKILDILDQYEIKATFFLRANGAEHNPSLARAILEEGHEIANHTYSHPVATTLSPESLQEEVVKAHQVITEAIQQQPAMLFRPPTGAIDDNTARVIAATGYRDIAMYDVTVLDWEAGNDADTLTRGVLEQTKGGSVILLHMLDDIHTVEALPTIIEKLSAKGYTFVIMSELMK
ncbi:polysaccharide deacetylase family protein [Paenibacillus nanensis]|uniref:polysaccharide deacetylase family protein n=1 Tax=Paenibacillus nanensis TaxID=393251 RepID=UPI001F0C0EB1|nr:polysaccharide deacetylase family protein [Paenibacillus nanensis]